MNNKCRVCHQDFYPEPLLTYNNMPKSAQFFPDADTLNEDKGEDLEICQCSGCGLVQLSNEPVHYYKEVIRAAGISAEMTEFRQRQFSDWIEKYVLSGKKILEIGCGAGEYLSLMAENNVTVFGIEQGLGSVTKCLAQGLIVKQDYIDAPTKRVDNGPFDAFLMLNFLEHIPDPNAALSGIGNNLADDAIGLIEVPNFDMILRNNLFSEFISDHLFYFTKDTFISTLTRNGFDVLECSETWHDYSISAVVKKRKSTDLNIFATYQQRLTHDIHAFISQFSDNGVAIWGAGHQALAVMALTNLENKIKYVVDSAPFKQNKYTPATHIPIVSPNTLYENPVEAVIVMAASYSNEVVRIIQEQHGDNIRVAVLSDHGLVIN